MREAIIAFGKGLSSTKAVGLFYLAGHGAQLAWRNYLIPVDGEIASVEELRDRGVDVNSLVEGMRLAVRRRSNGTQVPWESTSLEQDFWFIPPKALKKLADAEIERDFELELALWEKIQHSASPEPLEDYLGRFPSGRFAELAQLQLDRVLAKRGERKIEVASAPKNPYIRALRRRYCPEPHRDTAAGQPDCHAG
jgi:hypothetical protein